MAIRIKHTKSDCADCGLETLPRKGKSELYMIDDDLWNIARHVDPVRRSEVLLCVGCVERRLGRMLDRNDFDMDLPINDLKNRHTPRLMERLTNKGK
jgi:hypothetical protein